MIVSVQASDDSSQHSQLRSQGNGLAEANLQLLVWLFYIGFLNTPRGRAALAQKRGEPAHYKYSVSKPLESNKV